MTGLEGGLGNTRQHDWTAELWVILGGFGLVAASFVPWYDVDPYQVERATRSNGWQEPDAVLSQAATVLGAALAMLMLLVLSQRRRPTLGDLTWGMLITAASAVVLGLVALKFALNLELTTVGIYLALGAATLQFYGSYLVRLAEKEPKATTKAEALPLDSQGWPETTYFLSVWLSGAPDVDQASHAYHRAFATDPARLARLLGELQALLDPKRADSDLAQFLTATAPRWVGIDARAVLHRAWAVITKGQMT